MMTEKQFDGCLTQIRSLILKNKTVLYEGRKVSFAHLREGRSSMLEVQGHLYHGDWKDVNTCDPATTRIFHKNIRDWKSIKDFERSFEIIEKVF